MFQAILVEVALLQVYNSGSTVYNRTNFGLFNWTLILFITSCLFKFSQTKIQLRMMTSSNFTYCNIHFEVTRHVDSDSSTETFGRQKFKKKRIYFDFPPLTVCNPCEINISADGRGRNFKTKKRKENWCSRIILLRQTGFEPAGNSGPIKRRKIEK